MTIEYSIGSRVLVDKRGIGFTDYLKGTIVDITISHKDSGILYVPEVMYEVELDDGDIIEIIEGSCKGWTILGLLVEEENKDWNLGDLINECAKRDELIDKLLKRNDEEALEERISTIEERLGVLDNHVKKYIVDKVENEREDDKVLTDRHGNKYYLFDNGICVKTIDVKK